jgi:integrase
MSSKAVEAQEWQPGDRHPDNPKEVWTLCTSKANCPWYPTGRWIKCGSPLKLEAAGFMRRCTICAQRERWQKPDAQHGQLNRSPLTLPCGSTVNRAVRDPNNIKKAETICVICGAPHFRFLYGNDEQDTRHPGFCEDCKFWTALALKPEHYAAASPERTELYAKIARVRKALEEPASHGRKDSRMPFWALANQFIKRFPQAAPLSRKSQSQHVRYLTLYFEATPIGEINEQMASEFRDFMLDNPSRFIAARRAIRSKYSVGRILETLRRMLAFTKEQGWIKANPFPKGTPLTPSQPMYSSDYLMTVDEEDRLLAACVGDLAHLRASLIYMADVPAYQLTSLRLHWSDVDFDNRRIVGNQVLVEMTPRLFDAMEALRKSSDSQDSDLIFTRSKFQHNRAFHKACQRAGISGLRLSDIRRTGAWRIYQVVKSEKLVALRLGMTHLDNVSVLLNVNPTIAEQEANSPRFQQFIGEQFGVAQNGNGQQNIKSRPAHRHQDDRDQWLLEIINKMATRYRAERRAEDDEAARTRRLKLIQQQDIADDLEITVPGLRGRLDECGWREMFPSERERYHALLKFVAAGVDRGETDEEILANLKGRLTSAASHAA